MKLSKTFVGFGFGPIQSGLFLYEAYASGNFSRFVVAEVDAAVVQAVRANGQRYRINIARKDRIDCCELEGIEIYNPRVPADRRAIVEAVAASDELATCLPSVKFYDAGQDTSVARMIAEGLSGRTKAMPTIVYAAENHNHAAELLREAVGKHDPGLPRRPVEMLNTVIGKMSGIIADCEVIERMGLATATPGIGRAVLVEEFNRILISRVTLPGCRRGIEVFAEKADLLPFEEAKLYGHNAVHALIAYLSDLKGLETIAQAGGDIRIMRTAHDAFLKESGAALIRRHAGLGDPLFTPEGYRHYAEDLLERMVCPNLNDLVSRVGRDHVRKLAFDDRLFGTMDLALQAGIEPVNLALGAAAGVVSMIRRRSELPADVAHLPERPADLTVEGLRRLLLGLWGPRADRNAEAMVRLTWQALEQLRQDGWMQ